MSSILELNTPAAVITPEQRQKAGTVKTLGIVAFIFAVLGIFVPFVCHIAAFFISRHALKISRENLVPVEAEKLAYWANRVSITGLLLWVVILIRILAN
ncbi:MAG TPA: hypothetical protein PKE69_08315 [Pyrinomonadaceae bacterium]|nr:hypothetical protein [Pyrinomonadaceae bacterium]